MIIPKLEIMDLGYWFRQVRNEKLNQTDWTQANDSPLSDSKKAEWQTYRQKLRDLPQFSSPKLDDDGQLTNVEWPTPPDRI